MAVLDSDYGTVGIEVVCPPLKGPSVAVETPCQTPGAQFETHITSRGVTATVLFNRRIELGEDEAKLLDDNIHNALEMVLARYFTEDPP